MAAQSNAERQKAYRERNATKSAGVTVTRKPRGRRKPTANQIASNVGSILEMGNEMALAMVPAYRLDALQPYEIQLLSNAAAAEILANAALLKWYQSVGSQITGPHTLAAAAIVAVALPRLARRNMVPGRIAAMAQGLALGMSNIGGVDETWTPANSADETPPAGTTTMKPELSEDGSADFAILPLGRGETGPRLSDD